MPKIEETVPWAATLAASRELYPRKNIYFTAERADRFYDLCIWQTHVQGYEQLSGEAARSSSSLINDLIHRHYLKTILDPGNLEAFTAWRTAEYQVSGRVVRPDPPEPDLVGAEATASGAAAVANIYLPSQGGYVTLAEARVLYEQFLRQKRR